MLRPVKYKVLRIVTTEWSLIIFTRFKYQHCFTSHQCMTAHGHDICSGRSFNERGASNTLVNNSRPTYYLTLIVPLQTALRPPMSFQDIFQWLKKHSVIASKYKLACLHLSYLNLARFLHPFFIRFTSSTRVARLAFTELWNLDSRISHNRFQTWLYSNVPARRQYTREPPNQVPMTVRRAIRWRDESLDSRTLIRKCTIEH